jgi:fructose-1,6-bisphosphatase/inositol monophosphatase family enzyme
MLSSSSNDPPQLRPAATSITTISVLLEAVEAAGRTALTYFRDPGQQDVTRKLDGSLVTAADTTVEAFLTAAIAKAFPSAALVGEEGARRAPETPTGTFLVDPIDGTEAFACGSPAWCIAVGLLDTNYQPVAGIVHAPAWGSTWFADVDHTSPATVNGCPIPRLAACAARKFTSNDTLLVDSKAHRTHRFRGFPGKVRSYGSTALHGALVAGQRGFHAAQLSSAMAWDVAAPHAICRRVGVDMRLHQGGELTYDTLLDGAPTNHPVLVVPPHLLAALSESFQSS